MPAQNFSAIVLAAGKGTRMRSDLPKVMHSLAGRPMLGHVLGLVAELGATSTVVVTAPGMDAVRGYAAAALSGCLGAVQAEQLGTAHAVLAAREALPAADGTVLILYGDTPLIRCETLAALLAAAGQADLVVLGMRADDPKEYGRLILRDDGTLDAIVEHKDATPEQRAITLCNSGVMAVGGGRLFDLLAEVGNANAKGEYYLTDLVAIARGKGLSAAVVEAGEAELLGINSRAELAAAEAALQARLRETAMENGATLIDPASVTFSHDTRLGRDVVIEPNVFFGPGVTVGDRVRIKAFSHLEGAAIADGAVVGPFARLRPGARLGEDSHVGNFVEVKNATLGRGAKANHLSYLGDATIGAGSNIGAGTITCNYDGFAKHRTIIGNGVFVGSHTALVAPVEIGDGAIIGAGSTITRNVAKDALALTRPALATHEGAAELYRRKRQKP